MTLGWLCTQRLLEQGYVTKDPDRAHFFVVPAYLYAIRGSDTIFNAYKGAAPIYGTRRAAAVVLDYVKLHWPYWNQSNGYDHIWTLTQDHGWVLVSHSQGLEPGVWLLGCLQSWQLDVSAGQPLVKLAAAPLLYQPSIVPCTVQVLWIWGF